MFTKIPQQQLEIIRSRYLQQNKSLAQHNSFLMMKCNSLENKISQLLSENTQMKTEGMLREQKYDEKVEQLRKFIDTKFEEISQYLDEMKCKKVKKSHIVPKAKTPLEPPLESIKEESEPQDKSSITEEQKSVHLKEEIMDSSTPHTSPQLKPKSNRRKSEFFQDLTIKLEAKNSSALITDDLTDKKRQMSKSLKRKRRRKLSLGSDTLIAIDKKRDNCKKLAKSKQTPLSDITERQNKENSIILFDFKDEGKKIGKTIFNKTR